MSKKRKKSKCPTPVLTVDQEGNDFIVLSWEYASNPFLFNVCWSDNLSRDLIALVGAVNPLSYEKNQEMEGFTRGLTIALLDPKTTYYFRIFVLDEDKKVLAYSAEVEGTTRER